ncbi:MAG: hypothetical protein SO373_07380 [Candidatus Borkfalkiaceae bacterium]|nr:hypothetical protein [Christensenellaceae bacterium]
MEEKKIDKTKKSKVNKILSIVGNVVTVLVAILAFFVVAITITAKRDSDGTATVFGMQLRFVKSGSMEKCDLTDVSGYEIKSIPVKSCIFIEVAPTNEGERTEWYKKLKVGDVLTFKYTYASQETITHRIVSLDEKTNGGFVITLEGDNKSDTNSVGQQVIDTSTEQIGLSRNYVIGKVVGQSYLLGLAVYALSQPICVMFLIVVPCVVIILLQVQRIIRVTREEKAVRTADDGANALTGTPGALDDRDKEIEELKKRIAELEGDASCNTSGRNTNSSDNTEIKNFDDIENDKKS